MTDRDQPSTRQAQTQTEEHQRQASTQVAFLPANPPYAPNGARAGVAPTTRGPAFRLANRELHHVQTLEAVARQAQQQAAAHPDQGMGARRGLQAMAATGGQVGDDERERAAVQNGVIGSSSGRWRTRVTRADQSQRRGRQVRTAMQEKFRRQTPMQARQSNPNLQVLIEQPQEPEEWAVGEMALKRPGEGFPSFLAWPETRDLIRDLGLKTVRLDQGSLGHWPWTG